MPPGPRISACAGIHATIARMMTLDDFQALFRATPYPYLVMAPDLTIVGASGAYLRSVQRTAEDIVGRYAFDAFPAGADDPDATNITEVRASMLRALAKGEPDTTAFVRYAVEVNTPDGKKFEERYWSTVHTPVLGPDGQPILVFQNPVDVTELYRFDQKSEVATLQLTPPSDSNAENFNRAQMHARRPGVGRQRRTGQGQHFHDPPAGGGARREGADRGRGQGTGPGRTFSAAADDRRR